ncbi:uncharacterized protein LOC115050134 [Echeneis naucrates]|uniref:uncharacterized protein LOC115050134 n=1 Tax=Echeneis naucrates TaxID=173247 RepID=UPI001113BB79|nr:uncharacterized protein LOC115050134 [Echeneis naucrates]
MDFTYKNGNTNPKVKRRDKLKNSPCGGGQSEEDGLPTPAEFDDQRPQSLCITETAGGRETSETTSEEIQISCSPERTPIYLHCSFGNNKKPEITEKHRKLEHASFYLEYMGFFNFPFLSKQCEFECPHLISSNDINNYNIGNNTEQPPILHEHREFFEDYCRQHGEMTNQHAFAVIYMKGSKKTFSVSKPHFRKKSGEDNVHTEEILLEDMCIFMEENKNGPQLVIESIVIYTLNSPCMKREKADKQPCMFNLFMKVSQWYSEYRVLTYVYSSKFWGPFGSGLLNKHKTPKLQLHLEFPNLLFQVNSKYINSNSQKILQKLASELDNKDKNILHTCLKNATVKLKQETNKHLTFQKHLEVGREIILLLKFPPQIEAKAQEYLISVWNDAVEKSASQHLSQKVIQVLNHVTVTSFLQKFKEKLGDESPIKFFHVPREFLNQFSQNSL